MTLFEESEAIVADLRSQGFRSAIEAAYAQDGTQLNSSDYWFPKSGRRNYSPFRRHLGGERQEQSPPHVQDLKPPSTDKPRTPQEKPPHQEETIPNPPGVDPGYDPNRPFWNRPPDRLDPRYRNYDPSPHQDAPNDYIGSPFYYEPWLPFSPLRRFNLPREVVIPILQRGVEDKMSLLSVDPSDPNAKVYLKIRPSIAQISVRAGSSSKWAYNGTGFFVTRDGQLATAYHVVDDAQEIQVKTSNGDVYQARVKEKRPTVDLAVLELIDKKPGETFIPLPIAKSSSS
ncbi:MAG TPA: trypsin-like peptidase domain-containing protein, partial [Candidatus Obscuribacterales bacterium]